MDKVRNSHSKERGTALVEFALCLSFFWVPLFLGTVVIGFSLIQAIQVTQVCRDGGHMYAFGTDFSQTSNKYLLASLAPGLNIDPTGAGGNSVAILSTITYVDDVLCPSGKQPDGSSCSNYHQTVFSRWIVVGKSALHNSAFQSSGTAPTTDSSGNVVNYLDAAAARVTGFSPTVINLTSSSQLAYVSELYTQPPSLITTFLGQPWVNAMSVF